MKTGTKIRINKGQIETLIIVNKSIGLFESNKYRVCRNVKSILPKEIVN